MSHLEVDVFVFDPVLPSKLVKVSSPGIDTWYKTALITKDLREKLKTLRTVGHGTVPLSSGMGVEAEAVEIGLDIGGIRIDHLTAHVVDQGAHGIMLGEDVLEYAFRVGREGTVGVRVSSARKDDPEALALELYPVEFPTEVVQIELFLRAQRELHNIALIALGQVAAPPSAELDHMLFRDVGIPRELRLQLTWVDSGSVWLTLKSGCVSALKYSARFFETGASAKLAEQVAEAQSAKNEASINEATRNETIERIKAEQERLKTESIAQTHAIWRKEALERLKFHDELLRKVKDPNLREELAKRRDRAIEDLLEQGLYPMVRNLPRAYEPPDGVFLLGAPTKNGGK